MQHAQHAQRAPAWRQAPGGDAPKSGAPAQRTALALTVNRMRMSLTTAARCLARREGARPPARGVHPLRHVHAHAGWQEGEPRAPERGDVEEVPAGDGHGWEVSAAAVLLLLLLLGRRRSMLLRAAAWHGTHMHIFAGAITRAYMHATSEPATSCLHRPTELKDRPGDFVGAVIEGAVPGFITAFPSHNTRSAGQGGWCSWHKSRPGGRPGGPQRAAAGGGLNGGTGGGEGAAADAASPWPAARAAFADSGGSRGDVGLAAGRGAWPVAAWFRPAARAERGGAAGRRPLGPRRCRVVRRGLLCGLPQRLPLQGHADADAR